jgi:hypothetical protein
VYVYIALSLSCYIYMLLLSFAAVSVLCSSRVHCSGSYYLLRVESYPLRKTIFCAVMFVGLMLQRHYVSSMRCLVTMVILGASTPTPNLFL